MLSSVVLVVMLILPGMDEPRMQRFPMASFEACMAKIAEAGEGLKAHDGEAYRYFVGCETTGNKADPA
jgi:hypothetical protein